jgi:cytochrome c-type biogenesis protein CcmF
MLAEVGSILIGLALATTVYAACATFWSIHRADPRWAQSGRNGVYAATGLLALALLVLLAAFLSDQFQTRYVAQHSNRDLDLYLKVSAVWAGQEGSLLLWAFLQALFAALVAGRPSQHIRLLVPWATVFLSLITAFFVAVTLFLSNPFTLLETAPPDGQGLNPLLRHPGMIFHPPTLYVGYVGLAVPFAFALAALVTRQVEDWPTIIRRWTLVAWLFLGLGLLLGMRWAYDVLGWGGYWGWDPVENAGLMPWLTATALLHSTVMQAERRGFRWWNMTLAILSFALVLLGTFTTRSGLILSVHAFVHSNLGLYFLGFIALTVAGSLALLYSRRAILASSHPTEGILSRDGIFLLTLIVFLTITASVLVGSLLPTLTGGWFEVVPAWFDRVTGPQFAALALLLGLCPLLGRAADTLRRLRRRGLLAILGAVAATVVAALVGFTRLASLVGFAVVGLAGTTAVMEIARAVVTRSRREGEHPLVALGRLFSRNHPSASSGRRRKYGGYLVHIGVVMIAMGVIGTRVHALETEVTFSPGKPMDVGGYTLVYEDLWQEPAGDHLTTWASIAVYRDGTYLTTLEPHTNQYLGSGQTAAVPALRTTLREDLYLVLFWWSQDGFASVKVIVNPLINFLWLGGLTLLAGGTIALWPPPSAVRAPVSQAWRRRAGTVVGLAVGLIALAAAGLVMWGTGRPGGRPPTGYPAPDFTLTLLDGSTLALSELSGRVVVVNFWATWCTPCEEELPALQAIWEEYQEQVTFVGVAFQEDETAVQEMAAEFGLTYPVGLDPQGRIYASYGLTGVPETFVIDPSGKVAYKHIGPVSAEQLRGELDSLLEGQ